MYYCWMFIIIIGDVVIIWKQYLSPLTLWVRIRSWRGVMNTTLCDKVCQWLAAGRWFSPCTPVSSTNKTDRHDISEILLKVAFWTHLTKTYLLLIVVILWNTSDILVLFKFVLRTCRFVLYRDDNPHTKSCRSVLYRDDNSHTKSYRSM
jgi:hypothetical protein